MERDGSSKRAAAAAHQSRHERRQIDHQHQVHRVAHATPPLSSCSFMKAVNMLDDQESLAGRATALREIQLLAVQFLEQQIKT
jgi:hypothetical protein